MKTFLKIGVFLVSFGALASQVPKAYQYWFDKDFSTVQKSAFPSKSRKLSFDASKLGPGGHVYQYRLQLDSETGNWGVPGIGYFYVPEEGKSQLAPAICESWIDGDYDAVHRDTIKDNAYKNFGLDASSLSSGGHTLSIRYKDTAGHWGPIVKKSFYLSKDTLPTSEVKKGYQYWFDKEISKVTTCEYTDTTKSFKVDLSSFSEGGHILNYRLLGERNVWGTGMSNAFFIPLSPDASSREKKSYRVFFNNDIVSTNEIDAKTATLDLTQTLPDNIILGKVNYRDFSYYKGRVTMKADGIFSYAVQMQSKVGEWGAPIYEEISYSVSSDLIPDSVAVPGDYNVKKVDNNHFSALRFRNDGHPLYLKPSQDCHVTFYYVSGTDYINSINSLDLYQNQTTYVDNFYSSDEVVAVFYDTPTNSRNPKDDIYLRIMYGDNIVPKPSIQFDDDSWKVSINCDDPRAKIYYTTDGKQPNKESQVYSQPFEIDKKTTVKAFAVMDSFADSKVETLQIVNIYVPTPELVNVGGNLFKFQNRIEDAITYYTLDGSDPKRDIDNRLKYEGKEIAIPDNTRIWAYSEKEGLEASNYFDRWIYLSDYLAPQPSFNSGDYYNSELGYYEPKVFINRNSNGTTYYRMFTGTDDAVAGDWTEYTDEMSEKGFIVTGNTTFQAYSTEEGKSKSFIASHYTDWVRAGQPVIDYDNYMLKLSSPVPGGKVYYYTNSDYTDRIYDPDSIPDGIDVRDEWAVYAYVKADGYSTSGTIEFYRDNYNLSQPSVTWSGDTIMIYHNDPNVSVVVNTVPVQDYETVNDTVKFVPLYDTEISAYAKRKGYNNSSEYIVSNIEKPRISIDGYRFWIDNDWYGGIYYTTDGSLPTRESTPYTGTVEFTDSCTVRAVRFVDGYVAREAEPAKVMNKAAMPVREFNYGKIKFSSETPGAQIYYSFDYGTETLYNPEETPDGVDMKDAYYIYAYAEAPDHRRSDNLYCYSYEANLSQPSIEYTEGYVEIKHDDPTITIVANITPVQDYETVSSNHIRFKPLNNTEVTAYSSKEGYNNSSEVSLSPNYRPTIYVSDYYVNIDYDYWSGVVYYTLDGTMPTAESVPYENGFTVTGPCTVRAVFISDSSIPGEAEPAKVLDPVATPVVDFDNGYCKLSTTTPNATIYYSIDRSITDYTKKVYDPEETPNGIDMSDYTTIYAYATAEGYRQSQTLDFNKYNYTLNEPSLSYADGYVVGRHNDEDVTIKFFDEDGNALEVDPENPRRAKAPYNKTVSAYAYKRGYVNSSSAVIYPTTAPTITADLFTVSINTDGYWRTVRYTTDGTTPTASSKVYSNPFKVTETCDVRAVAFEDGMIPAEAEKLHVTYRKAVAPSVGKYDGRYLTLAAEEGSRIRYATGVDADPNYYGYDAEDKIDVEGLNIIKAVAQRDDADPSDIFTLDVKYYSNDTDVYTTEPGQMKDAFKWCSDLSLLENLTVHGIMDSKITSDNEDYTYLRKLPALKHLDLSNLNDTIVPTNAFDSCSIVSVVLPRNLKEIGSTVFGKNNTTICAVQLPGDGFAPDTLLNGVKNPNLLLYVKNKNLANPLLAAQDIVKNVVALGSTNRSDEVTLVEGYGFHAPKAFTAQKISFRRSFTKETPIGGFGAGWETLVLPFEATSVTFGGTILKPFGLANTNEGDHPYWLFKGADTEWVETSYFEANVPYLISFPNNPLYADEYNVRGDVVFSSTSANVPETPWDDNDMSYGFSTGKFIVGNYGTISKEDNVWAINDNVVQFNGTDYQPGSIFVAHEKDIKPFECYVTANTTLSKIPIFESSDVDEIMGQYGTKIWSEGHDICIRSGISMKVRIYDTVGQLLRIVDVKAGETVRAEDFNAGIYIVGNTKIYVKG